MALSIIELNDSEIRVSRDTEITLRTPGYAVINPDSVILGEEAMQLARLNPREASNRFWLNLNQDALGIRSSKARHHADLAYRQLLMIHELAGKPDEFIFCVPGSLSDEQLSLLLGIVEACPFSAAGLVDTAVAGTAATAGRGDYVHIDIHLHQTVLTFLSVADDEVSRQRVQIVDESGLTDIYDTCAGIIADQFIQQSRFDPLHHAETEQSLYNQIPACLTTLQHHSEASLEVHYDRSRHQIRVSRDSLLQALEKHYARILDAVGDRHAVLLGDRLGPLPGFRDRVHGASLLPPDSVFLGIRQNRDRIYRPEPPLSFVTRLPATSEPNITPPSASAADTVPKTMEQPGNVTHILIRDRAVPLSEETVYLSANGAIDHHKHDNSHCSITRSGRETLVRQEGELSLYINGHRINGGDSVVSGDTLGFAGSDTTYRFIHVLPG